jgi:hypothetical protein
VNSEIRFPSRKAWFRTRVTGRARAAISSATRSNSKPPTTTISDEVTARAKSTAYASSGRPATEISALGNCRVKLPRRLPRPAAISTTGASLRSVSTR